VEIGKIEIVTKPVDIRQTVDGLYQSAKGDVNASEVAFTCYIDPKTPAELLIDESRVKQALGNLITNSVQYTTKGRIHIHVTPIKFFEDGTCELSMIVADTGRGITDDQLAQIFEHSSGIGLTVTRGLARMMGGDVTVSSKAGRGSEFKMRIKAQTAQNSLAQSGNTPPDSEFDFIALEETSKPSSKPSSKPVEAVENISNPRQGFSRRAARVNSDAIAPDQLAGLNILIVEDIPANQEILRSLLEPVGCIVSCAGHGQIALDMMEHQIFDAVLMDIRMPVLDGIETTIAIRQTPGPHQSVPIIALTADASAENNAECLAAGADVFLTKPVVVSELFSSIRYARRKQVRQKEQVLSA
jgi:CheY-like chemotaxis protein